MTATRERSTLDPLRGIFTARWPAVCALTALMLFAAYGSCPARADLIVQVNDSDAVQGGTGAFDVILLSDGGTFLVAGFSLELSVPSVSGVMFTDVTTSTSDAYLFGTLQAPPFSFDTFPNQDFSASDFDLTAPGSVTVNPGDVFGLAHVTYSVDPKAPGGPVIVSLVPAGTSLSDDIGDPIAITTLDGTIRIPPAVPEPPSLVLTGLGSILFALGCQWRRWKRSRR